MGSEMCIRDRTNGGVRTTRNPRLVELSEVRKLIVRFARTKRVYSTLRPRHCPQGAVNALKRGYAGCNDSWIVKKNAQDILTKRV